MPIFFDWMFSLSGKAPSHEGDARSIRAASDFVFFFLCHMGYRTRSANLPTTNQVQTERGRQRNYTPSLYIQVSANMFSMVAYRDRMAEPYGTKRIANLVQETSLAHTTRLPHKPAVTGVVCANLWGHGDQSPSSWHSH